MHTVCACVCVVDETCRPFVTLTLSYRTIRRHPVYLLPVYYLFDCTFETVCIPFAKFNSLKPMHIEVIGPRMSAKHISVNLADILADAEMDQ